jgi:hypothetical protein
MRNTVRLGSRCALRLRYVDLVASIEVAVEVCNCLIQFLLTMVLSTEERVFLVEYLLREGNTSAQRLFERTVQRHTHTHCRIYKKW